ncbi:MAG: YcjF family protein [Prochlorothrix sp.]
MTLKRQYWLLGGGLGLVASLWIMDGLAQTLVQVGELTLTGSAALLGVWWLYRRSTQAKVTAAPLPSLDRSYLEQTLKAVQTCVDQLAQELKTETLKTETLKTLESQTPAAQTSMARPNTTSIATPATTFATTFSTFTTTLATPLAPRWAAPSPQGEDFQSTRLKLQAAKNTLALDLDRSQLRLAIVGGAGVGKTAVLQLLEGYWRGSIGLHCQEMTADLANTVDWAHFDVVLWVTTGDLTEGDRQWLQHLSQVPQPLNAHPAPLQAPTLIVALNKLDQYNPGHQATLLTQLCHRLQGLVPSPNIVPLTAAPAPIHVRRQQTEGSWQITQEQPEPALTPLLEILAPYQDPAAAQTLIWNTTYRQGVALHRSAHAALNQVRRQRALPVIERYQWMAGGAALVNPVPSLDLLTAVAINGQLVLEISRIYHKPLSLEQGQELAATLGELLVKLGLVEVSTQALATVFKSNGLTFWAGAGLQGVSAAYLTRMAGLSLVEYFAALDPAAEASAPAIVARLQPIVQRAFSAQGQLERLQAFGHQAIAHLKGQVPSSQAQTPISL